MVVPLRSALADTMSYELTETGGKAAVELIRRYRMYTSVAVSNVAAFPPW